MGDAPMGAFISESGRDGFQRGRDPLRRIQDRVWTTFPDNVLDWVPLQMLGLRLRAAPPPLDGTNDPSKVTVAPIVLLAGPVKDQQGVRLFPLIERPIR